MTWSMDRREFIKGSAGLVSAAAGLADAAAKADPASSQKDANGLYKVRWYEFTKHPDSDTCWSLSVGRMAASMPPPALNRSPAVLCRSCAITRPTTGSTTFSL